MRPKIILRRGQAAQLQGHKDNYIGEIALVIDKPALVMWDGNVWREDVENFGAFLVEHYKQEGRIKQHGPS